MSTEKNKKSVNQKINQKKKTKKPIATDIAYKKVKNRETNIISYVFIGLFMLMAGYLVYFTAVEGPIVINNSYNKRIDKLEETVKRGDILANDGTVLATTVTDDEGNETRQYTYGNVFCHVVGLSTHGKSGIEKLSNFYLLSSGSNLLQNMYNDVSGQKSIGDNVVTTLDVNLQQAAYDAIGSNKGAVVIMQPSTGKILAMVSKPDYDPNDAAEFMEQWLSYDSSDSVLYNRATQGLYPPGSTFKVMTTLEYIKEHSDYDSFFYQCSGSTYTPGASVIHCFDETVHGGQSLKKAFANSCNSAFATIGQQLDLNRFSMLCSSFLFNAQLPLDIEYNSSSFTLNASSGVSEIMETSIGQGKTLISPIHNCMIAATIANNGTMMKPYLIDRIVDSNGNMVEQYSPTEYANLMTIDECNVLSDYMHEVVKTGTGYKLKGTTYDVAGKTGSAQYDDTENFHSWFIGFSGEGDNTLAVSVILEGGYKGVTNASEVVRKILDTYYK